jgi:hypothetical protein
MAVNPVDVVDVKVFNPSTAVVISTGIFGSSNVFHAIRKHSQV